MNAALLISIIALGVAVIAVPVVAYTAQSAHKQDRFTADGRWVKYGETIITCADTPQEAMMEAVVRNRRIEYFLTDLGCAKVAPHDSRIDALTARLETLERRPGRSPLWWRLEESQGAWTWSYGHHDGGEPIDSANRVDRDTAVDELRKALIDRWLDGVLPRELRLDAPTGVLSGTAFGDTR